MTMINKSELMKRAWELSVVRMNNFNRTSKITKTVKFFFSYSLEMAWAEMKENNTIVEIQKVSTKKASAGRYVELLSVAIKNDLNHGASWYASGKDIDTKQLHPSWENEEICYVYAA